MAEGTIPVGGVSVDVTPNAEKWNRMLRAAILAGTEKIGREAGAEVASGIKSEVKDAIPDAIKDSKPEAAAKVAGVKAGDSFAGSFDKIPAADAVGTITAFRERVREIPHRHLWQSWLCITPLEAFNGRNAGRRLDRLFIRQH